MQRWAYSLKTDMPLLMLLHSEQAKTDEMLNVLMAARDTTASLIASTMYELASNPDIQDAARQEVLNFVGAEDHVSFQDVKNLKTLRAVLNETLRYGRDAE